ncbi:MAG: SAM-dependent methyltransferase [Planctomycetota bacterium]
MRERRFGPRELYAGSRFLAPLSEEALMEAGAAAGLREGATLFDVGTGNGCAAIFLAEAFHLYVRGVEADPELLELARANAARSPARQRIRFTPPEAPGPVDVVAALRVPFLPPSDLLRPGGRLLLGRFVAPEGLGFPVTEAATGVAWRRDATPLEWERFLGPLEMALREHRAGRRPGEAVAPLAEATGRQIEAFRAHAAVVRYEILVA